MVEENSKEKSEERKHNHFIRYDEVPLTEDTTCGFGPCRGGFLQRFATKTNYVIAYSLLGFFLSSSWAYFNGTISTMEKRFKIPSRVTGFMTIGRDISGFFTSIVLSYWAGTSHRPRWIALATLTSILDIWLTALPHFIYGSGEDALKLTKEYEAQFNITLDTSDSYEDKLLCGGAETCMEEYGSFAQPFILFVASFIGGIGGGLYYSVGLAYIDDNIKKKESPLYISISMFIRTLGPSCGYAISSYCLKIYIAPTLTPTITPDDPRWMGAWWIGWLIHTVVLAIFVVPLALFPKVLPETAAIKALKADEGEEEERVVKPFHPSVRDMFVALKRLLQNKIYFYNNLATIAYCLGESPYWIYLAKYIESQYRQTASAASFITGSVGLGSTATGLLMSGYIISKFKPSARTLTACNVVIGLITVTGTLSYVFVNCEEVRIKRTEYNLAESVNFTRECNAHCDCEFVPYGPVCSENNETFITACHAGCQNKNIVDGITTYSNCSCVNGPQGPGTAKTGLCPVDCTAPFHTFLAILSLIRIAGAAGIASNFLVEVRCIHEKDKSLAMGLSITIFSLAFAPAPILYGYIIDNTCLVWGRTCSGHGNCWLYNGEGLASVLNLTAACFIALGTAFDLKVWYESKNIKIFD